MKWNAPKLTISRYYLTGCCSSLQPGSYRALQDSLIAYEVQTPIGEPPPAPDFGLGIDKPLPTVSEFNAYVLSLSYPHVLSFFGLLVGILVFGWAIRAIKGA